jgi:hypothetical protein
VQQSYSQGMSLWFHRVLKKHAQQEQKNFVSESDRMKARMRLSRSIENAGAIDKRKRVRLASQIVPSSSLEVGYAPSRHDGNAPLVKVSPGMENRADNGERPDGFLRGRRDQKKATNRGKKEPAPRRQDPVRKPQNDLTLDNPKKFMARITNSEEWSNDD